MFRRALVAIAAAAVLAAGCGPTVASAPPAPEDGQWIACDTSTVHSIEFCFGPYTTIDEDFGTWTPPPVG